MLKLPRLKRKAFTLAELLISMAILGVIATFTIPKMLNQNDTQSRKAVMKEVVGMLSSQLNEFLLTHDAASVTNDNPSFSYLFYDYLKNHINYSKLCPTDSVSEGCWNTAIQGPTSYAGLVLPNGAVLSYLMWIPWGAGGTPYIYVLVDWNGVKGPNKIQEWSPTVIPEQDQFMLALCGAHVNIPGGQYCEKAGSITLIAGYWTPVFDQLF
jgi:prepilin-type N-terminal cleavage/methylation domain-containing protein